MILHKDRCVFRHLAILSAHGHIRAVSQLQPDGAGDAASVKTIWKPQNQTPVDESKAGTLLKLLDALDEDDDVQNVYSNEDIADDVMERLSA